MTVYTSIDITGGTQTQAVSINATGQIVGTYLTGTGINTVRHGFLDNGDTITTIDVPPEQPTGTVTTGVASINDSGWIIGNYEDSSSSYGFADQGFLDIDGTISTIDVPGSSETQLTAINASGEIVGFYQGSDGAEHGFLDHPTIDPSAAPLSQRHRRWPALHLALDVISVRWQIEADRRRPCPSEN
jgi:hypothetical protein